MHTTPEHLIQRLTARNMHLLALRISSYLQISPDAVLKHWAVSKIKRSKAASGAGAEEEDAQTCQLIVDKFQAAGDAANFADIAKNAWENGRGRLATMVSSLVVCWLGWRLTGVSLHSFLIMNLELRIKSRCCL